MTGADVKRQVMEAMQITVQQVPGSGLLPAWYTPHVNEAAAALAPCIVLTAEEYEAMNAMCDRAGKCFPDQEASDADA